MAETRFAETDAWWEADPDDPLDVRNYLDEEHFDVLAGWVKRGEFIHHDYDYEDRRRRCSVLEEIWERLPEEASCIRGWSVYRGMVLLAHEVAELLAEGVKEMGDVGCSSWTLDPDRALKYARSMGLADPRGDVGILLSLSADEATSRCLVNFSALETFRWPTYSGFDMQDYLGRQDEVVLRDDGVLRADEVKLVRILSEGTDYDPRDPDLASILRHGVPDSGDVRRRRREERFRRENS